MSSALENKPKYTPLGGRISKDVKNHINDPQAIEKAVRSYEVIDKYGFPDFPKNNKNKSQ